METDGRRSLRKCKKDKTASWMNTNFSPVSSLTEEDEGAHGSSQPVSLKRERDEEWLDSRGFISRVSLDSVDSKIAEKQEEQNPLLSWPQKASPAAQPAKSWSSSEDTGEFCTFEAQSTRPRVSKRFRKYCSNNPYAAQAAAASLLAGAAWLEAVQALQALNSMMDSAGSKARS